MCISFTDERLLESVFEKFEMNFNLNRSIDSDDIIIIKTSDDKIELRQGDGVIYKIGKSVSNEISKDEKCLYKAIYRIYKQKMICLKKNKAELRQNNF